MDARDKLLTTIRDTWGDSEEALLAELIVELVESDLKANYIPYSQLKGIANARELQGSHVTERVVQYLLGAESHVLELGAELIEDDDVHRLDRDAFSMASLHHIHPITGEKDEALPSKLFVYFYPSDFAREVLGGRRRR